MSSVVVIKEKIENPMDWYSKSMSCKREWIYDDILKLYHIGNFTFRSELTAYYLKICRNKNFLLGRRLRGSI